MSGVKHTPWKHEWVEESCDWAVFGCVYPPDDEGMAHQPGICTLSDFCDEDEARLIAAAPDLLEAGEGLLAAYRAAIQLAENTALDGLLKHSASWASIMEAAIARARGES